MKFGQTKRPWLWLPLLLASMATLSKATNLAVILPQGQDFANVLNGIKSELGGAYSIIRISDSLCAFPDSIALLCKKKSISGLVLMDTKAILASKMMEKNDSEILKMPKFICMTLQVKAMTHELHNVAGIGFEVPGYTLLTGFRNISEKKISQVAVFHRKAFSTEIATDARLLEKEMIKVIPICIDCNSSQKVDPPEAEKVMLNAFEDLVSKSKIDLFWIVADNLVINNRTLVSFWLDKAKNAKIPNVAPIETFAETKIGLATFTAAPDYLALGIQLAGQITAVFEEGTPISTIGFEPLISVKTTVNLKTAKEYDWPLNKKNLLSIDRIIN